MTENKLTTDNCQLSSEHRLASRPTSPEARRSGCVVCGKIITDRVYRVQRRRLLPDGRILLRPEFDDYCTEHYRLPSVSLREAGELSRADAG